MSTLVAQVRDDYRARYDDVVGKSVAALGEADSLAITDIHCDFLTIRGEVLTQYPHAELGQSLLFVKFLSLPKKLLDLQHDFLCARYDEIGRELRFILEMACRARRADVEQVGKTAGDKAEWLGEQKLNWVTAVKPTLMSVFGGWTKQEVKEQFNPTWERMNQVVHPSKEWLVSGVEESHRLHFNFFDEQLARQTLADVREVMGVVWGIFLLSFPAIIPALAADGTLFRQCPQVRLLLPTMDDSGSNQPVETPISSPASTDEPRGESHCPAGIVTPAPAGLLP